MYLCALFGCIDLNLITLILSIAILFGLTDFLTERYPRLQRDIYYIAFGVIAFLFIIKYYYGPDIWNYARFYAWVGSSIPSAGFTPFRAGVHFSGKVNRKAPGVEQSGGLFDQIQAKPP